MASTLTVSLLETAVKHALEICAFVHYIFSTVATRQFVQKSLTCCSVTNRHARKACGTFDGIDVFDGQVVGLVEVALGVRDETVDGLEKLLNRLFAQLVIFILRHKPRNTCV